MSTYETTNTASLALMEQYLYGSSRLGVLGKGSRSYELTDHLGNVRAVVGEFKEVKAAYEYYAFGMSLAKVDNGYRYGFNGQERETELNTNITSEEYGFYDARLARRWNIDPVIKYHESSYAAFANNPIWFSDPFGADTAKQSTVEMCLKYVGQLNGELEDLGSKIKTERETLQKMEDLMNEHSGWMIVLGLRNPLASLAMVKDMLEMEEHYEAALSQIQGYEAEYESKYREYRAAVKSFKNYLSSATAVDMGGGIYAKSPLGSLHKNKNGAVGKYALYEIKIDGETYKWGLADASRVTKTDVSVKTPDGSYKTIPKGTPIKLYQQERAALMNFSSVEVFYSVEDNVSKVHMKKLETGAVWEYFKKNGYVPDGNTSHANQWKAPQRGKLPARLRTKK